MAGSLKNPLDSPTAGLAALLRRASAAQSLTAKVRAELASPVCDHVLSATRRGEDLVVLVDSAAWTAQVRYAAQRLKQQLEAGGEPVIAKLRVKVGAAGDGRL